MAALRPLSAGVHQEEVRVLNDNYFVQSARVVLRDVAPIGSRLSHDGPIKGGAHGPRVSHQR